MLQQQLELGTAASSSGGVAPKNSSVVLARQAGAALGDASAFPSFFPLGQLYQDAGCQLLTSIGEEAVHRVCNTERQVMCVWYDTDFCPQIFRRKYRPADMPCGYLLESRFIDFSYYECETRGVMPLRGSLSCSVSLTMQGLIVVVLVIGTFVLFFFLIVYLCVRCAASKVPFALRERLTLQRLQHPTPKAAPPQSPLPLTGDANVERRPPLSPRSNSLLVAAQRGDAPGVDEALKSGVSVNTRSPANATALISAAQFGHHQVVENLLKADADPNLATDAGNTAVLLAAFRGHLDIVGLLVRWGADPRARNVQGWSAVDVPGVQGLLSPPQRL